MFVDLKLMIDEYKNFLKRNQEDIFSYATVGSGVLLYFFILLGGVATLTTVTRFVSNSTELNVYRENLATFQKCAEKVTDDSLIESYCGETPREPIIVW
jgi:hypothetical protein